MKKFFLLAALALVSMGAAAQNYMVVNTEKVFTSIEAYTNANKQLETLGDQYQKQVDDSFEEVEKMYNDYMEVKQFLSATSQRTREDTILNREQEVLEFQERIFGQEGELMKKRVELIKPIQDKVFDAINSYAEANGFDVVLDIANNPMVLYYSPKADKTQEIINIVK